MSDPQPLVDENNEVVSFLDQKFTWTGTGGGGREESLFPLLERLVKPYLNGLSGTCIIPSLPKKGMVRHP